MTSPQVSTTFREQIQQRLDDAQTRIVKQREAMDHVMLKLEQREVAFKESAESLMSGVLRPTLEAFAAHFENAQLVDSGDASVTRCELSHSVRFPATAHVAFVIVHDESIEQLTVQYEAHLLPVFIRYDRGDVLDQNVQRVDSEAIRQWAEKNLLGFLDSYLQIETHEQYQRDNVAIDPVCGMQVVKPKGLACEYESQTYYFCAKRCLDRFADCPGDFVRATHK